MLTKEEKIAQVTSQIASDAVLLAVLRAVVTNNLPIMPEENLNKIYYLLNPPAPPVE